MATDPTKPWWRHGKLLLVLVLFSAAAASASTTDPDFQLDAPNPIHISPRLTISGQPTSESLEQLGEAGYRAVIYLAPPTVEDAIPNEATVVGGQGLTFINIPIPFREPQVEHYQLFAGAMQLFPNQRVLVHCQINLRASAMTFLYRVIALGEDPSIAQEALSKVWAPNEVWRDFMNALLAQHEIDYELF